MENYTDPMRRLPVWERPEAIPFDLDSPEFWRRVHEHISPKHMADTFGRWCEEMDRKEWEAEQKAKGAKNV